MVAQMLMADPAAYDIGDALKDPLLVDQPNEVLQKLSKRFAKSSGADLSGACKVRVALNGGFTTKFLAELLPLFFTQRGLEMALLESDYGAFQTDIFDDESDFWKFEPGLVMLLPTHRDLRYAPPPGASAATVKDCVERELGLWKSLWQKAGIPVIQLTFDPPPMRPLAEADGLIPGGMLHYVRMVNARMIGSAPNNVTFIDAERLMAEVGAAFWHDTRLYRLAKQPMAMEALPLLANALAASASALFGKARKALIVDLDNTLWGGVVGDDGLEGIALGPETAEGESFVAFQHYLKALNRRGIVLAACSKNKPEIAREVFERHKAMVLQQSDFAVFAANFEDKVANIRGIAKRLDLGLDAFVFIDDSPVECALVREKLPEVWTIELYGDPSEFPHRLDHFLPFPTGPLTQEDLDRAESYQHLGTVQSALEDTTDIESFLRDLEPVAVLEDVRDDTVERIIQLIGKTNQFKLNPESFTSANLRARAKDVLAVRLKDQLQDYGIVSVAVTEVDTESDTLIVKNWVMSCRVFSRRLEFLIRECIAERAARAGLSKIRLNYIDSGRNSLVGELLPKLGFLSHGTPDWFEAEAAPPLDMPNHFIMCTEGAP
jgi:FkbH-like protein